MPVPVLTTTEMRAWEKASWAAGATEESVIASVGRELARFIRNLTAPGDRILILAGPGNNGADARAAEPHLPGRVVEVMSATDPAASHPVLAAALRRQPALVVDGLFGIGLNRPLNPSWVEFIRTINDSGLRVLAVDVPSGLNADTGQNWGLSIHAEFTLTVGAPKAGLLSPAAVEGVGRLEVARQVGLVGEPESGGSLKWGLAEDFQSPRVRRGTASHKGSFGHALVLAGSLGYSGAAVLAARAAGRARPGLVSVLTSGDTWIPVSCQLAAAMVHPFAVRHPLTSTATAILAGPGLAAPQLPTEIRNEVTRLWREFPGPMIVDASALDWLRPGTPCVGPRWITPHPGEAGRLLGISSNEVQQDRPGALRRLAQRYDALTLLKGHQTLIGGATGPIYVNSSGNPGLAQGGTGDVLAGFLAGLLAQPRLRDDMMRTTRYAVWRHGSVADDLESQGSGWTSEELASKLSA